MSEGGRQAWREHGFLVLLVALCAVLTVLQFRWTGELARVELERWGGDQQEAAERFVRDFDRELSTHMAALVPTSRQLSQDSIVAKVQSWRDENPRPMFSKIALAIPNDAGLELNLIDRESGSMTILEAWPPGWGGLQETLEEKVFGIGGGPWRSESGMLFEVPIFGRSGSGERDGGPGESGWMIFEIDRIYLTETWLPELVKRHINPGERDFHRVEILSRGETIYSSGPKERLEPPVSLSFNRSSTSEPGRGGPPGERRTNWQLRISRQAGALEEMVGSSRRRNLVLACGVNGLILAAGYALIRQTRKSRLLAEARMNFVANVSHELRTPVTVILGAAHNMKRGIVKKPEAQERYADLILQYGQQLSELVQEVLEFSVVKPGMKLSVAEPVAVEALLRETVGELKNELLDMEVVFSLPENLPMVAGDAQGLRRVFRNLIGNAVKHGGEGKWLGISARDTADGNLEITVADHGPGIPHAERSRIFEPFFRGSGAHAKQTRGTGLGLGMVRDIVAAHQGKVSVSSEVGGGATFVVSLPIAEDKGERRQ